MKFLLKRLTALAAAVCIASALLVQPALAVERPSLPSGWKSPFSDVRAGQWFTPYVASLYSRNVVAGYPDGRFGPDDRTDAGQAILMILKATGSGEQKPAPGEHYASGYLRYAVDQGFLSPTEVPDLRNNISRLFVCRLAAKALGLEPSKNPSPYPDVNDPYITAFQEKGLIVGVEENGKMLFKPDALMTRAQASVIVWQVMEYRNHIHFGPHELDILEGVPVNTYDPKKFSTDSRGRVDYSGAGYEVLTGIDVSRYQGAVQWDKVAADGVDYAMLRVGYRGYGSSGTLKADDRFEANLKGAQQAGLDVGVYFFSQAISVAEARQEARYVLELLNGRKLDFPVVFDWEFVSDPAARTNHVRGPLLTEMARAFCEEIRKGGYEPMVYTNQHLGYMEYDLRELAGLPLWLTEYSSKPSFYYEFQMWQYTEKGAVDGVQGKVDLNLCFKLLGQ